MPQSVDSNFAKLVNDEAEYVAFMGLIFDLRENRWDPCGDQQLKEQLFPLQDYLHEMCRYDVFSEESTGQSVVYADDQFVNQEFFRLSFEDFGLKSKLVQF